jgi:hypothetical protein
MSLKKTFLFFPGIIVLHFALFAQINLGNNYFSNLRIKAIQPAEYSDKIKSSLPFANVQVLDFRADTFVVGFSKQFVEGVSKVTVKDGISVSFKNFIQNSYTFLPESDTTSNLFIAIKKLWLSDQIPFIENIDESKTTWESGLMLHAEVYSEQNGIYHALYKVDSIIVTDAKITGNEENYLQHGIKALLAKVTDKEAWQIRKGKTAFSRTDINNHLPLTNSYPILNSDSLKRGVYTTFDEFKKNEPSITEFELKKDSKTDALYDESGGGSFLLRDCWGYCDGTTIYMKSSDNFFPLERSENTFDMRGFKSFKMHKNIKIGNLLAWGLVAGTVGKQNKSVSYVGKMTELQLDMETGELF